MKVFKLACAIVACSVFGQAHAGSWQYISVAGNEYKLSFNMNSVHRVKRFDGKQFYHAWFKQEIVNDLNPTDNLMVGDFSLNLWRVDCSLRKVGLVKTLNYRQSGQFINEHKNPVVLLANIIPSTSGEAIWFSVCTNLPKTVNTATQDKTSSS